MYIYIYIYNHTKYIHYIKTDYLCDSVFPDLPTSAPEKVQAKLVGFDVTPSVCPVGPLALFPVGLLLLSAVGCFA